jgi:hypothetical protein
MYVKRERAEEAHTDCQTGAAAVPQRLSPQHQGDMYLKKKKKKDTEMLESEAGRGRVA